ncbi:MAG: hypothetical protein ABSG49_01565 [Methanoregula sp.]|jgi:hypothetical protein|uniref:hypothetical protein n=1 Tax=Methanoregula sp. TaxID=2052170 RepID=UPI003C1D8124
MQYSVLLTVVLVIAGVLIAGCTQSQGTGATPAPAPVATTAAAATAAPQPSFSLGDHYLQKSYTFQSEKDRYTEQFRVDNASWGIDINVLPLSDNLQNCWFQMNVTNMDTNKTDPYGWPYKNSYEKHQQFPMYITGPYKIVMTGTLVKVDVTAAKRNP